MNDFQKSMQVQNTELNRNNEIIRKLNDIEKAYNPDEQSIDRRTNVLRGGCNVFLTVMHMAGMLYTLNDTSRGIVDTNIIGRVKSIGSIKKKEQRKERQSGKTLSDIIALNVVTERVHNNNNFVNIFRSNEIQSLYNERQSNLDLMEMAIAFVKSFEMYEIATELDDTFTLKESEQRLQGMKNICNNILENIQVYRKEDEQDNHVQLDREFPIRGFLQVMCEDLMQQEIDRAKKALDTEIKQGEIKQEEIIKKDSQENEAIKGIMIQSLELLKNRKQLLESKENWTEEQISDILYGIIDKEKMTLYKSVLKYLELEDILGEDELDNQKKYCELVILISYQLLKLQFVKEGKYEGIIYNTIWKNLYNQLKEYKNCQIDGGKYSNITFENLDKLKISLIRLNARLSDKLQFAIMEYEIKYHLKSVIELFTGEELPEPDIKCKENEYVGDHRDLQNMEIKFSTHYRNRVATKGSASYGNGRVDNKEEKKRELKVLNYNEDGLRLRPVKHKNAIIKQAKTNADLEHFINANPYSEAKKIKTEEWRKGLLTMIPRYFSAVFDEDKDVARIEFFSELKNVEKYYSETSVLETQVKVKEKMLELKDKGLLSDEPIIIEISRTQYKDFVRHDLIELRGKRDKQLVTCEQKEYDEAIK